MAAAPDLAAQAFAARVQRTLDQALACFPAAAQTPELEANLRNLCIEASLAHYNGQGANVDIRDAITGVADTLRGSRPSLASLNRGEIGRDVLKILERITPLGGAVDCPEPRRLTAWWFKVEAAIAAIDPATVSCDGLSAEAIRAMGMYLLGDAAWAVIAPSVDARTTWDSFKTKVESLFGLSTSRQTWALYQMTPRASETTAGFVRRVENERLALGANADACMQAHCHRLQLDVPFAERVEALRRQKDDIDPGSVATWAMVVAAAQAINAGVSFLPVPPPAQVQPSIVAPRVTTTSTVVTASEAGQQTTPRTEATRSSSQAWRPRGTRLPCIYCSAAGKPDAYHSPEACFINPGGPSFRKVFYDNAVRELRQRGQELPTILQLPTAPQSGTVGSVQVLSRPSSLTPTATGPVATKSVATTSTSTQAHTEGDALTSLLSMYGRDGIMKLVNERLQAYSVPESAAMTDEGPDLQCAGLDVVVADLAAPSGESANVGTTAKKSEKRTTKARKEEKAEETKDVIYKQLAELLGSLGHQAELLAAGDVSEVDMVGDGDDDDEIASDVPLAYQRRIRRLKDAAVNTGGVAQAGRIVRVGSTGPVLRKPREVTLDTLVKRIRISTPVVQETALDIDLRDLLLTYLILANERDGRATVVPNGVVLHAVPKDKFQLYHEQLTGVTASNRESVRAALAKEGFDGRGRALEMQSGTLDEIVRDMASVVTTPPVQATLVKPDEPPLPDFASPKAINCLSRFIWGPKQYVVKVQVDNAVALAMVDTGGHASAIDYESALAMGLDVTPADELDCGTYQSPGYPAQRYAGLVRGPIEVRFSNHVVLLLPQLRVVSGKRPLLILGADIICGGRPLHKWNFTALEATTKPSG